MADNVIPFPIERRRPGTVKIGADGLSDEHAVTREEMIQLVLRYAYGTRWAEEPHTVVAPENDSAPDDRAS